MPRAKESGLHQLGGRKVVPILVVRIRTFTSNWTNIRIAASLSFSGSMSMSTYVNIRFGFHICMKSVTEKHTLRC